MINIQNKLKLLPSSHIVLQKLDKVKLKHNFLVEIIRFEIDGIRSEILNNSYFSTKEIILEEVISRVNKTVENLVESPIKKVINGTGIILHTGLGRAPFGNEILKYISGKLSGYINLEFDLETGKRGQRLDLVDSFFKLLTSAESSVVVNNNAAAVLLGINTLAAGKEVIVSRGQLVEIGGSFRLPDVIEKSGAKLVEIGTTNRTHLQDYKKAINSNTGAILVAHPSNFKIDGFTKMPAEEEIIALGKEHKIPVMMDLGSGALFSPKKAGLPDEYVVSEIVKKGFQLISFSGDKLLGGPQAGIIVGQKEWINPIRENPLMRALRCDKLILTSLEYTIRQYLTNQSIPSIRTYELFTVPINELKYRAENIFRRLGDKIIRDLGITILDTQVEAGSGSMPTELIPSIGIMFNSNVSEATLAERFRKTKNPIIGYINNKKFIIDLKAISKEEIDTLIDSIKEVAGSLYK